MAAILADDIFNCIFLDENEIIPSQISPAVFQVMAWHRPGDMPLSEPMLTLFTDGLFVAYPTIQLTKQ